jgi:nucleoside-diphosphate kinase
MAIEQTLAIIKPDGMKHQNEILERIEKTRLTLINSKRVYIDRETAGCFYNHIKAKGKIYDSLIDYITSDEVLVLLYKGENAISRLRAITGPTDPKKADKGTIRGDLGADDKAIADAEERAVQNLIHTSGNLEDSVREASYFF